MGRESRLCSPRFCAAAPRGSCTSPHSLRAWTAHAHADRQHALEQWPSDADQQANGLRQLYAPAGEALPSCDVVGHSRRCTTHNGSACIPSSASLLLAAFRLAACLQLTVCASSTQASHGVRSALQDQSVGLPCLRAGARCRLAPHAAAALLLHLLGPRPAPLPLRHVPRGARPEQPPLPPLVLLPLAPLLPVLLPLSLLPPALLPALPAPHHQPRLHPEARLLPRPPGPLLPALRPLLALPRAQLLPRRRPLQSSRAAPPAQQGTPLQDLKCK